MRQRVVAAAFLLVLHSTLAASPGRLAAETEAWRAQREQDLKSETGWLTVAGLAFLRPASTRSAPIATATSSCPLQPRATPAASRARGRRCGSTRSRGAVSS